MSCSNHHKTAKEQNIKVYFPIIDVPGFALVTGAASGIGRACAIKFVDEGAAGVALLDLNTDALYLAGGRSSFVTGTALFVDGGYTQR